MPNCEPADFIMIASTPIFLFWEKGSSVFLISSALKVRNFALEKDLTPLPGLVIRTREATCEIRWQWVLGYLTIAYVVVRSGVVAVKRESRLRVGN